MIKIQFINRSLCKTPPLAQSQRQAQILILAFLDLDQISDDFEIEHFSKASNNKFEEVPL